MTKIQAKDIRLVPTDEIRPNPKNRNKHPEDQIARLAKIIAYQGFRAPVIVSNRSGMIVAGHGRLEAAKRLGLKEVPVSFQDFDSEEQEYAAQVSDNAIASWAELDLSAIHADLPDLEGFDIDLLGIENFQFEPEPLPPGDPDSVPEPPKEPRSKLGDLYILGKHRLLCGDSTNIQHVERLMNGEKAEMLFTDPPYGVKYDEAWRATAVKGYFGGSEAGQIKNDDIAEWSSAFVLCDVSIAYVWHASAFAHIVRQSLIDSEFEVRQQIIWRKPFGVLSRQAYNWQHEPCWYAVKKGHTALWADDNTQTTVWDVENPNHPMSKKGEGDVKTGHPTMKPVRLAEIAIKNHTIKSVLDLFGGSGSTLIACEKTKRRCFMMELDPRYIDVIVDRWEKYSGQKAVLAEPSMVETPEIGQNAKTET